MFSHHALQSFMVAFWFAWDAKVLCNYP